MLTIISLQLFQRYRYIWHIKASYEIKFFSLIKICIPKNIWMVFLKMNQKNQWNIKRFITFNENFKMFLYCLWKWRTWRNEAAPFTQTFSILTLVIPTGKYLEVMVLHFTYMGLTLVCRGIIVETIPIFSCKRSSSRSANLWWVSECDHPSWNSPFIF